MGIVANPKSTKAEKSAAASALAETETGANRGRLGGDIVTLGCVGEPGVPAVEVVGQLVVEDPGSDLEQQVRTAGRPSHLLPLDHAFADDLVDGRLD